MTVPKTVIGDESSASVYVSGRRQQLPSAVVGQIFDHLDVLDRCCLALCSKSLLWFAVDNGYLEYSLDYPPSRRKLQEFFEIRLGQGWVGDLFRYCRCCGTFASISAADWRLISERMTRERSGSVADMWRNRRDDGWLRYWIERWCDEGFDANHSAASAIRKEDKTLLLCPRCAVRDVESNAWRRRVSGSNSQY